jgi:hypothetical protein
MSYLTTIQEAIHGIMSALTDIDSRGIVQEKADDFIQIREVGLALADFGEFGAKSVSDGVVDEGELAGFKARVIVMKAEIDELWEEVKDWEWVEEPE